MAELYAMKEKLLLAGIVVCPTLEELYAALNSAKARLLGPTSLRIAMPQGRRSTVAGRAKKASPTTRKMQRRRSEAPDTYRLTVNVLSAKLREGSSRVYAWDASRTLHGASHTRAAPQLSPRCSSLYSYARVKCHGYKHKTHPPVKRSGRTASFGSQSTMELYQFNDVELDEPVDVAVRACCDGSNTEGAMPSALPLPLFTAPRSSPSAGVRGGVRLRHAARRGDDRDCAPRDGEAEGRRVARYVT